MKLISTAIHLNTSGVDCALSYISTLNDKIIKTREKMVYEAFKDNYHSEMDYTLQKFPNEWEKCLKIINNEFLIYSKNFLN
ncbi:MAG: hypothetical protein BGO44_04465 [Legionella sp. 39-23]|nr:MAG: hypothetical protein BGO44_04465 [Legionella sp. 39-23]